MTTFAQQLSALRKERGLTQEQLAQLLNVSRTTISRWESGRSLPDIETIKHLSQTLNYNFFADIPMSPTVQTPDITVPPSPDEESEPDEAPIPNAPSTPAPDVTHSKHWSIAALAGSITAAVLFSIFLFLMPQKAGQVSLHATVTPATALISVTPSSEIAYLTTWVGHMGEVVTGWDTNFFFTNHSPVPFTIQRISGHFYEGDILSSVCNITYDMIRPHMANDKLLNINDPLQWPIGTNHLEFTHLVVTMYGIDDNGNQLEASCTVRYIQEWP